MAHRLNKITHYVFREESYCIVGYFGKCGYPETALSFVEFKGKTESQIEEELKETLDFWESQKGMTYSQFQKMW